MSHTTIGVVVPARNAGRTLERTLLSLRQQADPPDEIIVVDDASTDDTAEISARFKLRVVRARATGPSGARNLGLEKLTTTYVAFLDADDSWPRGYVSSARRVLSKRAAAMLVAGRVEFSSDGKVIGRRNISLDQLVPAKLVLHNPITTSGVICSRQSALDAGGFDQQFRYGEDLDFWIRLLNLDQALAMAPTPVNYTVRDAPEPLDKVQEVEENRRRVLGKVSKLLSLSPAELRLAQAHLSLDLGLRYLKSGHRREALARFREAWRLPRAWTLSVIAPLPLSVQGGLRSTARAVRRVLH
jgi:glycosyltransferase involved in cell wall biosynthesis